MISEEDKKFVGRMMDQFGGIYYYVKGNGNVIGKVRVNLGAVTWQVAESFEELLKDYGGKVSWSRGGQNIDWQITGIKAVKFLKDFHDYFQDDTQEEIALLYILGHRTSLRGKQMKEGVIKEREVISEKIKKLNESRKRVADAMDGKVEYEHIKEEGDEWGKNAKGEIVDLDQFLLMDRRRLMTRAGEELRDRAVPDLSIEDMEGGISNEEKLRRHAVEVERLKRSLFGEDNDAD